MSLPIIASLNPGTSSSPCNLCSSLDAEVVGETDRAGRPLRTVICRACGLVRTDPMPGEPEIEAYYAREYRRSYKGSDRPTARRVLRALDVARDRHERLRPHLQGRRRLLDVGASSGEFLHVLRAAGISASGIEPNEAYSRWARENLGLDIASTDWSKAEFPAGRFDAVTLFHVLEHLADPTGALRRLAAWLEPRGILVVEVPNVEGTCGSPRGRFHFAHLHHFNLVTLAAAGEAAGLEVVARQTSPDGGNITVVFTQAPTFSRERTETAGNYQRVAGILRNHTRLRHYLAPRSWLRPLARAARHLRETAVCLRYRSAEDVARGLTPPEITLRLESGPGASAA